MLFSYLKTAVRSLWKNRTYTLINVLGLSLGIAVCLLIALFVHNEWTYDQFHSRAERLFRINIYEYYSDDEEYLSTTSPFVIGPELKRSFPEVEAICRVTPTAAMVRYGEVAFNERVHIVDSAFYTMFDFPLLAGNPPSDLNDIVLTPEMAEKYFREPRPLGKYLRLSLRDYEAAFRVSGIIEAAPLNSSIHYDFLVRGDISRKLWTDRHHNSYFLVIPETFMLLRDGQAIADLAAKTPALVDRLLGEDAAQVDYQLRFQPLTDIHLNIDYPPANEPTGDPAYSLILAGIALMVFFIACVNFMTLSVGHSASRAREVGVRKVMGAGRMQLVHQFWSEAIFVALAASIGALVLAELFLPAFSRLSGRQFQLQFDPFAIGVMVTLVVIIGIVAGSYPALVLSRFKPVQVFKGDIRIGGRNRFRRMLMVLQFGLSILLISLTLAMNTQLQFLQNKPLGYYRDRVLVIRTGLDREKGLQMAERYQNRIASQSGISGATAAVFTFGEGWMGVGYDAEDGTYKEFRMNIVRPGFLEAMGIRLVAGRGFDPRNSADLSQGIIVNEALVRQYGWENPLEARLPGPFSDHRIIGVTADFHYASLHGRVAPLVLTVNAEIIMSGAGSIMFETEPNAKILVCISGERLGETMAFLESSWSAVAPQLPFDYAFLDDTLNRQYESEVRMSRLINLATLLAIGIACMGLFGLAALVVLRRTKEIGVRKVLGARVWGIILLIVREFAGMIILAALLAGPIAYWAVGNWLQGFAYQADIGPGLYILAGLIALTIAVLTVSYQAVRAALVNPTESLRYE